MNFIDFLKDKLVYLLCQIVFGIIVFFVFSLFNINFHMKMLIIATLLIFTICTIILEYIPRRNYYTNLMKSLDGLEEKYYISELIKKPLFEDGKIVFDVLKQSNKSMNDEIEKYKRESIEYKEYIETWVHEIKTPISTLKLKFRDNKSVVTELGKIDRYVEQALYYAKMNNIEKDYIIKKIDLGILIRKTLKDRSDELIFNKATIKLEEFNEFVFSDSKWLQFILNQIITNSIKYKSDKLVIQFSVEKFDNKLILNIKDNGIGINKRDLPNIFEKGYTGTNGRKYAKSTGIGLYLCKKLCESMFLGIEIESEENESTNVRIIFPKSYDKLEIKR